VLRWNTVQRERRRCRIADYARHAKPQHFNHTFRFGHSEWIACMRPIASHVGGSYRKTVKPVRQCARRWVVNFDVAQAASLFSDNAPREVHLWR
jgi:hypothetical protein